MNQTEKRIIANVIHRLRAKPGAGSTAVNAALQDRNLALYLETWVIAPLEIMVKEQRSLSDLGLADRLARVPKAASAAERRGAG